MHFHQNVSAVSKASEMSNYYINWIWKHPTSMDVFLAYKKCKLEVLNKIESNKIFFLIEDLIR